MPRFAPVDAAKAHHLPRVVDRPGLAVVAAQMAEIGHNAVCPQERVGLPGGGQTYPHDLTDIVDVEGSAPRPAQGAERGDDAVFPEARAHGEAEGRAETRDLPALIDRPWFD